MTTMRKMGRTNKRTGRKYAKLIGFLTARLDHPKESIQREAADTLAKVLMHIDEIEDRKAARVARAKAGILEPVPAVSDTTTVPPSIDPSKYVFPGGTK
jgi:hypothetical protein